MPLYDYKCGECNQVHLDVYHSMHAEHVERCECGATMAKAVSLPHVELGFAEPIEMHSVAVNSLDEIRELKRKCPDVDISEDENSELYGIPVARTRTQKKAVLAACGYVERN